MEPGGFVKRRRRNWLGWYVGSGPFAGALHANLLWPQLYDGRLVKAIRIRDTVEAIPGGMMVVPLLAGAAINTFCPQVLAIGGFTTALARGAPALIGAFLLCMGAGITLHTAPRALRIGVVVTLTKFLVGVGIGLAVAFLFGDGGLWGLSSLAVIAAMTNTNGGLYAALAGEFGDESEVGAIAVISINDGPFLTMVALGAAGIASVPFMGLVAVIAPILIGMLLGNLDPRMRDMLQKGGPVLIPFFAFALGAGIDFMNLLEAGLPGVVLGFMTTLIGGFFAVLADRATGGTGVAGAAASSTAGNAVATPEAVALVDPSLRAIATAATPQVAASTVTTALLTPLLTSYIARRRRLKSPASQGTVRSER